MYLSWIVGKLLHFPQIVHELDLPVPVSQSTDDQPATSYTESMLRSIQYNFSSVRDVVSVGIVNLTGFTLEEMFKREIHKPAEPVAKFSVNE